jgi:hypothetical protein
MEAAKCSSVVWNTRAFPLAQMTAIGSSRPVFFDRAVASTRIGSLPS